MREQENDRDTPRRKWFRVAIPPLLFEFLIVMARLRGYSERTLYEYLYQAVKRGYPEDFAAIKDRFDLAWLEPQNQQKPPNDQK